MLSYRQAMLGGVAVCAVAAAATPAAAQVQSFDIPAQPARTAIPEFGRQSGIQILAAKNDVGDQQVPALKGEYEPREALRLLLAATNLRIASDDGRTVTLTQAPQGGSAAGASTVEALIVTAQKREEDIQDVPIAISAFSQEDLTRSQVAGGPDLMTQVPNMTFTKTNFSSYSIQIRGIGTQAISATTDPAVAVAFNNTPFIRNRFFEQEFYDLERVEVLRGPQGTLYGRNATAGVVNIISAKPKFFYESKVSADISNYSSTRLEAMANIPLAEDAVALRVAGAWTKRDGYATNEFTGKQIDGRDLWSTRVSLRFAPAGARFDANLIWEHFEENDDRLRSSKQLCKKHVPTEIGGIAVPDNDYSTQRWVSQGCERVSLYSDEAFQTPNGHALPYFSPLTAIGLPLIQNNLDPYRREVQSRDLRVIESTVEPEYRAKSDVVELQVSVDLTDALTLTSETAYSADTVFSLQDYNRFTTRAGVFEPNGHREFDSSTIIIDEDGIFCDPQLGCSDRLLLVDLSTSDSTQFSQELRLSSDFEGPFNFSLGANFLRHDTMDKYYVFINSLSLWGAYSNNIPRERHAGELAPIADPTPAERYFVKDIYVDPNPIGSLNDMGRNYFLSKNPYKLISYAAFGEAYYNLAENLKLTGGLRFTVDKKEAPQIPSWLLAGSLSLRVISVGGPYPTLTTLEQEWREPTGRLAIDWKPSLDFTDETLFYASYAHGYKAGGANPPPPIFTSFGELGAAEPIPDKFDPEFVDAFEVGAKNTLLDGALTLNLTGFYYDYEGYQVSEIRNRSAINSNYDAEVWGLEIEADWRPLENLKLAFKGGYQNTRIADGEQAIDLMDRSAGDPNWIVNRPFPSVPSNCIVPIEVATVGGQLFTGGSSFDRICVEAYYGNVDPVTLQPYVPDPYPEGHRFEDYEGFDPSTAPNGGKGIFKDLGGNELPNAPNYTATLTADYTLSLPSEWLLTLHSDVHWQSESWWRVFNDHEYNKLDEFYVINLAAIFANEDAGWRVMAYIKNVLDNDALTGAFLNSDDSGLTTNVFLTDPRLYGLRVTKDFRGGVFGWGGWDRRDPSRPYLFHLELGGGVSRMDGDAEVYGPWIPDVLSASPAVQEEDLDWGDIRDVKLTYAPGSWRVSAAYRFGKANGDFRGGAYEDVPPGLFAAIYWERDNHAITLVDDSEEYTIADFMVGKDVGIGAFGDGAESVLSAGLRYASFSSGSHVRNDGITESYYAERFGQKYGAIHWNRYTMSLDSTREFEGTGPALSWESSLRLLGEDRGGHADMDWKLGAAVLFGKQTVDSVEDRFGRYYHNIGRFGGSTRVTLYDDVVQRHRSKDVTVPNVTVELGLSYTIDRVKVGAGYSYDRFFDVIDGGFDEAKQYDRTIQGPYFRIAVGFGG